MKHKWMKNVMAMAMMILATAQISADNSQTKEAVSCQTIAECEQLAHTLEAQIGVFEHRDNLSNAEKKERYVLKKQLLSTQRKITAKQREIIKQNEEIIKQNKSIINTLDSIGESLK